MNREAIVTDRAPNAIGPYSQAIRNGNLVFLSGQLPVDPATGKFVSEDVREQARQCLSNLDAVAKAVGGKLASAVKVSVFVSDIKDFPAVNEVYANFFEQPYPARSTIEVGALPLGALVEIDAIIAL